MVNAWKDRLARASRSRRVLWRFAIGTLLTGVLLGAALDALHRQPSAALAERLTQQFSGGDSDEPRIPNLVTDAAAVIAAEWSAPAADLAAVLDSIPAAADVLKEADLPVLRAALERRFTPEEAALLGDFLAANFGETPGPDTMERLRARADTEPPQRFANHALGLLAWDLDDAAEAARRFQKEGAFVEAADSRRWAVEALLAADDYGRLAQLRDDPRYAAWFNPHVRLEIAIGLRDWAAILVAVPWAQLSGYTPGILAVALLSGLSWAFILGHLFEIPRLRSIPALVAAVAFVAGVVSTTPTLYAVIAQEDMLGWTGEDGGVPALLAFIGGVGLREELCKLLLFLPLLPFLLRRDDESLALLAASFVGLGFAIEENGSYFADSQATAATGRFLTANFFHVALTGLNGLYLYRALAYGWTAVGDFLAMFGVTVLAHGLYNALLVLGSAEIGGYVAMAVYVGLSMVYFDRARHLRGGERMTISLSGAFVAGLSVVTAASIVYSMTYFGAALGLRAAAPEVLGSALLVVMFVREFDEPLSA